MPLYPYIFVGGGGGFWCILFLTLMAEGKLFFVWILRHRFSCFGVQVNPTDSNPARSPRLARKSASRGE